MKNFCVRPIVAKSKLERLYDFYNSRKWVHPDPLEFLYNYPDEKDREIAGLIASSLAYGRVAQILKSVSIVLEKMGPSPYAFINRSTAVSMQQAFGDFKHRFTTGKDLAVMLEGIKRVIHEHGSLYSCFLKGVKDGDDSILSPLCLFVKELKTTANGCSTGVLPSPEKGSACKRLNLYLRWMVREDRVDPGGWKGISPSMLIIPLDTHMHRIARQMNMTKRKSADMKTAMEITNEFRKIDPEDPVRYDFALTRLGIRKNARQEILDTNIRPGP